MIEYHIVVINDDDSETRLKIAFLNENEAFEYARKNITNNCRIMEVDYHLQGGKRYYDDEICVYSESDEEDEDE